MRKHMFLIEAIKLCTRYVKHEDVMSFDEMFPVLIMTYQRHPFKACVGHAATDSSQCSIFVLLFTFPCKLMCVRHVHVVLQTCE